MSAICVWDGVRIWIRQSIPHRPEQMRPIFSCPHGQIAGRSRPNHAAQGNNGSEGLDLPFDTQRGPHILTERTFQMDLAHLVSESNPQDWDDALASVQVTGRRNKRVEDNNLFNFDSVLGAYLRGSESIAGALSNIAPEAEIFERMEPRIGTAMMDNVIERANVIAADEEKSRYFPAIKAEFAKLLCGHADYEDDRERAEGLWNTGKDYVLMAISAAIGASLGVAAAIILPIVTFLLYLASKMGVNVWCRVNYET